jgi:hypothetical protein
MGNIFLSCVVCEKAQEGLVIFKAQPTFPKNADMRYKIKLSLHGSP